MIPGSIIGGRYGPLRVIESDFVVSEAIRRYGEWAELEIELISQFVADGDVVADVGAYIGSHARAFSELVGKSGWVYAFEPRREIFDILLENCRGASYQNVMSLNRGLGAQSGFFDRRDIGDMANAGAFSIYDDASVVAAVGEIEVISLDDVGLRRLDFIKIDVEGMERDVLDGGKETIRQLQPIVHAEVNSLQGGLPLLDWCRTHRYAMYCSLVSAFNPANFFGNTDNMFGNAVEVGALLIPVDRLPSIEAVLRTANLIPVAAADDLVNVLLLKPQYWPEVLWRTVSATVLFGKEDAGSRKNASHERASAMRPSLEAAERAWHANLVETDNRLRMAVAALEARSKDIEILRHSVNASRDELSIKDAEYRRLRACFESAEVELRTLRTHRLIRFLSWLGVIGEP